MIINATALHCDVNVTGSRAVANPFNFPPNIYATGLQAVHNIQDRDALTSRGVNSMDLQAPDPFDFPPGVQGHNIG